MWHIIAAGKNFALVDAGGEVWGVVTETAQDSWGFFPLKPGKVDGVAEHVPLQYALKVAMSFQPDLPGKRS